MTTVIAQALAADTSSAVDAVVRAAIEEAQRRADEIVPRYRSGTAERDAELAAGDAAQRQLAWQLVCLRIELAAGIDAFEEVLMLRRSGATWAQIAEAAGTTRQSAHERWGSRVIAVLDRYGDGQLGGPVADDDPSPA